MQLLEPLFEFSGACAGCGETPYIKLLTQLFGDRLMIANATGCSSIYGGNLPTTPYTKNRKAADRRGRIHFLKTTRNSVWGCGWRSISKDDYARYLVQHLSDHIGAELVSEILAREQTQRGAESRRRGNAWRALKKILERIKSPEALDLIALADTLVKKSVWLVGGDGWAYDIGVGGLDHVLGSGMNVNVSGAGHGSLFEHGRANVQGHAARRGGEVCDRRKANGEERPGARSDQLRKCLRGARGDGRKRHAHGEGIPGSGSVRRAVADHRVQPLHRARIRHGARHGAAESGGAVGLLAAHPLQPALRSKGQNPFQLDSKPPSDSAASNMPTRKRATPCWPGASRPTARRAIATQPRTTSLDVGNIYEARASMPAACTGAGPAGEGEPETAVSGSRRRE